MSDFKNTRLAAGGFDAAADDQTASSRTNDGPIPGKRLVEVVGSKVASYETADISSTDHTFAAGLTEGIYVDIDATVVLTVGGSNAAWNLTKGFNPIQATAVIKTGTDTGVVIRGVYGA